MFQDKSMAVSEEGVAVLMSAPLRGSEEASSLGERSLLAQRDGNCRRVAADRISFYTYLPGTNRPPGNIGGVGILEQGERIELLDGGRFVSGYDGRTYFYVAASNGNRGYISTNSQLVYCGHRARW
jgi:hypothetical protein